MINEKLSTRKERVVIGSVPAETIRTVANVLTEASAKTPERVPGTVALRALVPEIRILLDRGYTVESIAELISPHIPNTTGPKIRGAISSAQKEENKAAGKPQNPGGRPRKSAPEAVAAAEVKAAPAPVVAAPEHARLVKKAVGRPRKNS
jgi:hypothetical protein